MKYSSRTTLGVVATTIVVFAQSAFSAEQASQPQPEHAGKVTYLSGGIGSDQSAAIKQQMGKYPLVLEFAGHTSSGNDYLADVPVKIVDSHGETVLSTLTTGPFLLVAMPDGHYTVTATYNGQTMRRRVDVHATSHAHSVFIWAM